jgi:hypothetical protein
MITLADLGAAFRPKLMMKKKMKKRRDILDLVFLIFIHNIGRGLDGQVGKSTFLLSLVQRIDYGR